MEVDARLRALDLGGPWLYWLDAGGFCLDGGATGGHSRGHQATLIDGTEGVALLHLGDLLVTDAHLPPAWVSALDDFPLDTIAAKRDWLGRAAREGWWVAFSHDAKFTAGRLDAEGRATELQPVRS